MSLGFYLGLDTSNYTTSAAAVTTAGEVFCAKRPLSVPDGERGLRQSDALFCHTRDLANTIEACLIDLRRACGELPLLAVGAAETPRRAEGSYMPCFLAGKGTAQSIAHSAGVPYFAFSHQEGHLAAARYGAEAEGRVLTGDFCAFHLSGGTTELYAVQEEGYRYRATLLAEALDLTCGQLIDRCGVKMGLPFPCGAPLEALLPEAPLPKCPPIKGHGCGINLSGFENRFDRLLAEGRSKEDLAAFVFSVTVGAVKALLRIAKKESCPCLFTGGVASSRALRSAFEGETAFFAPPPLCTDNAVGIALMTKKGFEYERFDRHPAQ